VRSGSAVNDGAHNVIHRRCGAARTIFDGVEGDRLAARTERLVSTRATLCVGYWAALYINRDGGWSVACDALGCIIRCETEKLALSVARYRRRRLGEFCE